MAKLLKQVRLEEKMIEEIQDIAFEDFDQNFTAALIDCLICGINMRKVPESVRLQMKSGIFSTKAGVDFYNNNSRVVIDALKI